MLILLVVVLYHFGTAESLVRESSNVVVSRQFNADRGSWYDVSLHIKYSISNEFYTAQKEYIREQFKKLEAKTCLTSIEYPPYSPECKEYVPCIRFIKDDKETTCRSDQRERAVYLPGKCFTDRWVLHEILHILGFSHEHQREDRDCYVEVNPTRLSDPEYQKRPGLVDLSFPYDVHSIMHYRRGLLLNPARFALDQNQEFGSYDELTEMDVIALNYMFCEGKHYCDIYPKRCQDFRCWIECNPCSDELIRQCENCTGNTY